MSGTIYTRNGYEGREQYLLGMADKYGVPLVEVIEVAELLGVEEDFDGLVTMLSEYYYA